MTLPDIDIDFCMNRRGLVIDYVTKKYGRDNVSQIITFGTMAARGVIRDTGRGMEMTYAEVDKIAKMVPTELHITLDKALEQNPDLKSLMQTDGAREGTDRCREDDSKVWRGTHRRMPRAS